MPIPEQAFWEYEGHFENDEYSTGGVFSEDLPGLNVPAIIVRDFKFSNVDGGDYRYVQGLTFLAPIAPPFYHALMDVVGEYELIKAFYPEVQLGFASNDYFMEFTQQTEVRKSQYIQDIFKIYNTNIDNVYNIKEQNYHFEKVVVLPQRTLWGQDRIVPLAIQNSIKKFKADECNSRRVEVMLKFVEKVRPLLTKDKPIKLYTSRTDVKSGGVSDRAYLGEQKIIEFFEQQGYTIVNMSELSLIEQLNLFYNATEIAGVKGSNLFGAVVADSSTTVYQIYQSTTWDYSFENYFKRMGLTVVDICKNDVGLIRSQGESHDVPVETILSSLQDHFLTFQHNQ